MALLPATPEEVEEVQRLLRRELRVPTAEARNVATATELDAVSYFRYRGTAYRAEPLSYRLGARLQEVKYELDRLAEIERQREESEWTENEKARHMTMLLEVLEAAVTLFHLCCEPVAFWKRPRFRRVNPFVNASLGEITDLLGFFFTCRMRSRVSILGGSAMRPSLSMSTTQTN